MKRGLRRMLVRAPIAAALCACGAALLGQDACVLAEPSGALSSLPEFRPIILHASVVPATTAVLSTFPSSFIVPVELVDGTVTIAYSAFVDYNPFTGEGLQGNPQHSQADPANPSRTRILTVTIPEPLDLDRCHVIEVVVALRLKAETDPKNAHTPDDPPGGDVVTWFFNPSGDPGGCPTLDAGIDAQSDSEAGEGGVQ